MKRRITLNYKLEDDKSFLIVAITEENENGIDFIKCGYDLKQYDEEMTLYNKMIDDFNAEYDDEKAEIMEKALKNIINS